MKFGTTVYCFEIVEFCRGHNISLWLDRIRFETRLGLNMNTPHQPDDPPVPRSWLSSLGKQ